MNARITLMLSPEDVWSVIAGLLRDNSVTFVVPEDIPESDGKKRAFEDQLDQIESACSNLDEIMETLNVHPDTSESESILEDIRQPGQCKQEISSIEHEVTQLTDKRHQIISRQPQLEERLQNLLLFVDREVPVNDLSETEFLTVLFGWIPAGEESGITLSFQNVPLVLIPLVRQRDRVLLAAASLQKHSFILQRFLKVLFFEELEISSEKGKTLEKQVNEVKQQIRQLDQEKTDIARKVCC